MECQLKLSFLAIKPCNADQIQMRVRVRRKAPQLAVTPVILSKGLFVSCYLNFRPITSKRILLFRSIK
jgi:hypothetical protein